MSSSSLNILVINGPNLNLLGTREPGIYGSATLKDVEDKSKTTGKSLNAEVSTFQANSEGAIVDRIHQARTEGVSGIVINAGMFPHLLRC
jgi:3-dehydroquinate dehydratase-2